MIKIEILLYVWKITEIYQLCDYTIHKDGEKEDYTLCAHGLASPSQLPNLNY